MSRPTGSELRAEVAAFLTRTGTSARALSRAAGLAERTVHTCGDAAFPTPRTVDQLRAAMAAYPDGVPLDALPVGSLGGAGARGAVELAQAIAVAAQPARPALSKAEADRRDHAPPRRMSPEYVARLRAPTPAESLATLAVETPRDLIETVKRQWPALWQGVVDQARDAGTLPGAMLCRVIERGLEAGA